MFLFVLCVAHISVGGFVRGKPPKTPKEFLVADAIFHKVDLDGDGNVDQREILELFHNSGANLHKEELKNMMNQADSSGDNSIQFDEFKEMFTGKTLT